MSDSKPLLIGLPGLLGHPKDFNWFVEELSPFFRIYIYDPHEEKKMRLSNLSGDDVSLSSSLFSPEGVFKSIDRKFPNESFFGFGISIGGKILFEMASINPERILGGVVTDVGLGPFSDSLLFKKIEEVVKSVNINSGWKVAKQEIESEIDDPYLLRLLKTQLFFPQGETKGYWKTGIKMFGNFLLNPVYSDQFERYQSSEKYFNDKHRQIKILVSKGVSGISETSLERMKEYKSLNLVDAKSESHFIHIFGKENLRDHLLSCVRN